MRGKTLQLTWTESVADLFQAYKQERDSVLKTRWQFLWLLRQGQTAKAASQTVGIHERTGRTWVQWYRAGGRDALRGHREGGKGRAGYLASAQEAAVRVQASQHGFISAGDAIRWVKAQYQVTYRPGGMYGLFRRLNLRWKVPRPRHTQASPAAQDAWKKGGSRTPSSRRRATTGRQ